jgi:hypothetical protein
MPAIYTVSDGAVCNAPPKTCAGIMDIPAAAAADFFNERPSVHNARILIVYMGYPEEVTHY